MPTSAPLGGRRLRTTCLLPSLALVFKRFAISRRPWFQVSEMQSVTLGDRLNVSDLLPNPQTGEIWVILELREVAQLLPLQPAGSSPANDFPAPTSSPHSRQNWISCAQFSSSAWRKPALEAPGRPYTLLAASGTRKGEATDEGGASWHLWVQGPGGMQRWGCEGEVQGRGKQCVRVPTRGRAAPSQTPGSRLRAALPHPFLSEVSLSRGIFPEPRLRQPLSRPRTAINAPSPEAPRSRGAWSRLTMFVLGSFLLVQPASPARWSHGVWGQGQGRGGPPG